MKKNFKRVIILLSVLALCAVFVVSALADTVYQYNEFNFIIINNYSVSVCGRSNDASDIIIPDTIYNREVVNISNEAFVDDTLLNSVDFRRASYLKRIGMFAFKGAGLSGELYLPGQITNIDLGAFQECRSLESVTISASVNAVPNQCFYQCDSLSSVTFSSNISTIGSYAFAYCPSLSYIEIPACVTEIADTAFLNDSDITLGVYTDTAAHLYAVEKGIDFILLDAPEPPTEPATDPATEPATEPSTEPQTVTYIVGDADGDGDVTILDSTKIQRVLADIDTDDDGMIALRGHTYGDDAELNIMDATSIQRFLADFVVDVPFGEEVTVEI